MNIENSSETSPIGFEEERITEIFAESEPVGITVEIPAAVGSVRDVMGNEKAVAWAKAIQERRRFFYQRAVRKYGPSDPFVRLGVPRRRRTT